MPPCARTARPCRRSARNARPLYSTRYRDPVALQQPSRRPDEDMTKCVGVAIDQVGDALRVVRARSDGVAIQYACLDSFFVNARLLAEFLVKRGNGRDFNAGDFGWPKPTGAAADRLGGEWYQLASQQVVHLSKQRLGYTGMGVDLERLLCRLADDVYTVAEEFVAYLEQVKKHPRASDLRRVLDKARRDLPSPPLPPRS